MIRHFPRPIAERIHRAFGRFMDAAMEELRLMDAAYEDTEDALAYDDGSQDPAWYPEISGIDNGWPVAPTPRTH